MYYLLSILLTYPNCINFIYAINLTLDISAKLHVSPAATLQKSVKIVYLHIYDAQNRAVILKIFRLSFGLIIKCL